MPLVLIVVLKAIHHNFRCKTMNFSKKCQKVEKSGGKCQKLIMFAVVVYIFL